MPGTDLTNLYGSGWSASGPTEIGSGISRRLQIEMGSELYSISPASNPFLLLLNMVSKSDSAQGRFDWLEDYNFNIRTFEGDVVIIGTTGGATNALAYLRLKSPSDAQGLEAPPFLTDHSNYDLSDILLVKITYAAAADTYTNVAWFILEKHGVENASQWRTIDVSGTTMALNCADVTGYVIMLAYNDNAGATHINFGAGGAVAGTKQTKGWHDTGASNGGIQEAEAIIVRDGGVGGANWGDINDAAAGAPALVTGDPTDSLDMTDVLGPDTDGIYPCYVEVYTPDMMRTGYYEGSGLPQESHRGVGHNFNYLQIFKTPLSMTGSARAVKYVGTDEWTRKRNRKGAQHGEDMEQAFLFQGAETISNVYDESPRRTTRGLGIGTAGLGSIKTFNVDRIAGATHAANNLIVREASGNFFSDMMDVAEMVFEDHVMSSGTKVMFGGPRMASAFANAALDTSNGFQYMPGEGEGKKWGLSVTTYITPHGTIKFVKHPKFRGRWNTYGVMLDFQNLGYRFLPGRDNLLMTNTQLPDEDKYGEAFLTEAGLECKFEQTHAIIKLI